MTTGPRKASLVSRFWIYQSERFPLAKTSLLVAVFSSSSVAVSARLAGRHPPGPLTFVVAFLVVLTLFFQMRACDELKDADDDARYRPERPVPRGLVSLREVLGVGVALVPFALAASLVLDVRVAGLLVVVWAWLFLMTREFFVPDWLRTRPVPYLISHMAIMPLIDLMVTGCEWAPFGGVPNGLWTFLGLSFANGCVLEIGRKAWAPENEREGVETYSRLWGPTGAALAWCAFAGAAYALLCWVGALERIVVPVAIAGAAGLAAVLVVGLSFAQAPTPRNQGRLDAVSGLWVVVCYASAGYLPLRLGGPS